DVSKIVGRPAQAWKYLLEIGEAAVERIAPRVNDPRIGQHGANPAEVMEIRGHFIGEMRTRCLTMRPAALQILLAKRFKRFRFQQSVGIVAGSVFVCLVGFESANNGGE